jgi:hypothetical protein
LREFTDLPKNIATYINDYDDTLTDDLYNDIRYSYRVLYVPKSANRKGQADKVIEFIPANTPEAEGLNKEYVLIKEKEKKKHLPSKIVESIKAKGFAKFGMHQHTLLWKSKDGKNPNNLSSILKKSNLIGFDHLIFYCWLFRKKAISN